MVPFLFSTVSIQCHKFLFFLLWLDPTRFDMFCFHFHWLRVVSDPLTLDCLDVCCFISRYSQDCLVFLLFSVWFQYVLENTLNESSAFKFVGVCSVGHDTCLCGEWPRSARGLGAFVSCRCGMVCQSVSVRLILPAACVAGASVSFLSFCLVVSCSECSVEVPRAVVGFVCFSFRICQDFSSAYHEALLGVSTAWIMSSS